MVETYPTESYDHIGIVLNGSKREHTKRAAQATAFEVWQRHPEISGKVVLESDAKKAILERFGPDEDGEDPFDAFVGLLGMLNVVLGRRAAGWPADSHQRAVEGWILGQAL